MQAIVFGVCETQCLVKYIFSLLYVNSAQFLKLSTEAANNDKKSAPENATTASSPLPVDNKQLEELTHENDKLLKERRDFEDRYKRALAEAENVRKRMHRQVEDAKIFGIQSFCKDLLEVADILGKAIEAAPKEQLKEGVNPHFLSLYEGLKMTDAQLLKVSFILAHVLMFFYL